MRAASTESPRDCLMWMRAIRAKWDGEGEFGKPEWDQLLGHCQAVCDLPAAAFAPELIAAYPNAKVILTNRDVDSWHKYVTFVIAKKKQKKKKEKDPRCLFQHGNHLSISSCKI